MVTSIESSEVKAGDALHAANGAEKKKVEVTRRGYAYDALGRPTSRTQAYPQQSVSRDDSFRYNDRSELTGATLGEAPYAYAYDNIGNRITAQEDVESVTYAANNLNQYTQIDTDGTAFVPEYDEDGNQTRVRTVTGIWKVQYNGQNRAIRYESEADSTHIITCVYDSQGRRVEKKEEKEGAAISHVRYVYRGYPQVAAYDLLAEGLPSLWQIIWDPTQEIATRPLAIRADGAYSTYGWDLTKNICETYAGATGSLMHRYAYSPYGLVSLEGDTSYQPLQWSSEVYDAELGLVYYNYRYYNPTDGRWMRRDPGDIRASLNLYFFLRNEPFSLIDSLGKCEGGGCSGECAEICVGAGRCEKRNGCCMRRTNSKNPKHEKSSNGCGSEEGRPYEQILISGLTLSVVGMTFTEACNSHDICYDECGADRSACDRRLYADVKTSCLSHPIIFSPILGIVPVLGIVFSAVATYYQKEVCEKSQVSSLKTFPVKKQQGHSRVRKTRRACGRHADRRA